MKKRGVVSRKKKQRDRVQRGSFFHLPHLPYSPLPTSHSLILNEVDKIAVNIVKSPVANLIE